MKIPGKYNHGVLDEAGHRKYVNEAERNKFLSVVYHMPERPRALLMFLTYSGCRISEALMLQEEHLSLEDGMVTLKTLKRRRVVYRRVPVPVDIIRMLLDMGVCENGRFWDCNRVTAWRWVRNAMTQAGVRGPMGTCKGLRHAFGIRAASRNVPPNLIQRWMGHASQTTTAIYLDAVGPEERRFAERMW